MSEQVILTVGDNMMGDDDSHATIVADDGHGVRLWAATQVHRPPRSQWPFQDGRGGRPVVVNFIEGPQYAMDFGMSRCNLARPLSPDSRMQSGVTCAKAMAAQSWRRSAGWARSSSRALAPAPRRAAEATPRTATPSTIDQRIDITDDDPHQPLAALSIPPRHVAKAHAGGRLPWPAI